MIIFCAVNLILVLTFLCNCAWYKTKVWRCQKVTLVPCFEGGQLIMYSTSLYRRKKNIIIFGPLIEDLSLQYIQINKFIFFFHLINFQWHWHEVLVLHFWFQIKMSFLPVGHTHEDIDQFFSRISEFLRKQDVQTLQKLLALIPKAYKKLQTTAEQLFAIFDIREWFNGHLSQMNSHSYPHVFRFTKCTSKWMKL